jgi:hypothetical protein
MGEEYLTNKEGQYFCAKVHEQRPQTNGATVAWSGLTKQPVCQRVGVPDTQETDLDPYTLQGAKLVDMFRALFHDSPNPASDVIFSHSPEPILSG